MGDIVNLRQFKKRNERQTKEKKAEENRILFGMTKQEKAFRNREQQKKESFLPNNRLEEIQQPNDD